MVYKDNVMSENLNDKKKSVNPSMTVTGLTLYGIIMVSLILIYRDPLITVTCLVIMAVMLVQYIVPVIREKRQIRIKKGAAEETPQSERD